MKPVSGIFLSLILLFAGCGSDPELPPIKVYVAGYIGGVSADFQPAYWKDDAITLLPHNNSYGWAYSVFVKDNDVFVAGTTYNNTTQKYSAVYWKNGIANYLGEGYGESIFVDGNDIYVAGEVRINNTLVAAYWKNGTPTELTNGLVLSIARSIEVKNNNVYVAGYILEDGKSKPMLWTNGTATVQGPTDRTGEVNDLHVDGTTKYTCGADASPSTGVYWKNNERFVVNNAYSINGITSNKNDVYVVGYNSDYNGAIWKNGIESELIVDGGLYDVFLFEDKPYATGYKPKVFNGTYYEIAAYWVDGVEVELDPEPSANSFAESIFVTR